MIFNVEEPKRPEGPEGRVAASPHQTLDWIMSVFFHLWSAGIFDMERSKTHAVQKAIKEADVQACTRCTLSALAYLLEGACELNYPPTKDSV